MNGNFNKKLYFNAIIFIFIVLFTVIGHAQSSFDDGPEPPPSEFEDGPEPPPPTAPINESLPIGLAGGLFLGSYILLKKFKKSKINKNKASTFLYEIDHTHEHAFLN